VKVDTHELAWAAGFFDGEGSIGSYDPQSLRLSVSQKQPELLNRFRDTMWGMGIVVGPYYTQHSNGIYQYQLNGFAKVQQAVALLWPYLGPYKKEQSSKAIAKYLDQWRSTKKPRYMQCREEGHDVRPDRGSHRCRTCALEYARARYKRVSR